MKALIKAQNLHAKGNLQAAQRGYLALLRTHPKQPVALANLGAIYLARQQFTQAITYLNKALAAQPNYKDALNNLLLLYLQQKDYTQAAQIGAQLVSLDPTNSQYVTRTYLAYSKQDNRQAIYNLLTSYQQACNTSDTNQQIPDPLLENYYQDTLFEFEDYATLETYLLAKVDQEQDQEQEQTPKINTYLRLSRLYREQHQYPTAISWLERIPDDERDGFGYHTEVLKTYGKAGQNDPAITSGQWLLEFKDQNGHEHADKNWVAEVTQNWQQRSLPAFNSETPERNIIAFSLFGDDEKYTLAAVVNAQLATKIYPGWTARFYCGTSVPDEICQALRKEGAQVEMMDETQGRFVGLFWRFFPANDPNVDYFISRDCDALLNDKEYLAVQEWLDSGKPFHLMRDHVQHAEIMLAGLWGGVAGWLPDIKTMVEDYYQPGMSRWADQNFQQVKIWPLIKPYTLTHDSFYTIGTDTRPFPEGHTLPKEWHVGGYVPLTVAKNFKASKKRQQIRTIQEFDPRNPKQKITEISLNTPSFENADQALAWVKQNEAELSPQQLLSLAQVLRYQFAQSDLLNLLGICLMKKNKGELALSLIEQAIQLAPNDSKYVFNAALIAIKTGQTTMANNHVNYFSENFNQPEDLKHLQVLLQNSSQPTQITI